MGELRQQAQPTGRCTDLGMQLGPWGQPDASNATSDACLQPPATFPGHQGSRTVGRFFTI